jgi:hypothetical protein
MPVRPLALLSVRVHQHGCHWTDFRKMPVRPLALLSVRVHQHGCHCTDFRKITYWRRGPGSSVGIATGYGLDGPGNESR